jgi:hypothetical protein
MFFHLGTEDVLAHTFAAAGFAEIRLERLRTMLRYALAALFRGGPVALAYSRFDEAAGQAVHAEYLESIAAYRTREGYRIPGEFVVAAAQIPVFPSLSKQSRGEPRWTCSTICTAPKLTTASMSRR